MKESGFPERSVASLAAYVNGYPFKPDHHASEGVPIVRIRQLNDPTAETDYYEGSIPPENHIDTGDLIFSWSGSLSVREWDRGFAYLNQHLFKVLPRDGIDQRWLRWALDYSLALFEPYMHGSAMTHITRPMLRDVKVPTPPVEEQRRIVDFLDDQVARIDGLVVGRETQLDLVTERRIAALDSMLRSIPGDSVQLRRILRLRQSIGHENETVLSLYRDIGIVPKADRSDNFNKTPEDLSRYQLVLEDDFVVNKMKAWSGSVAVSDRRGIVSPDYQVCEIIGDVSPRYLHHMMRSARTVNEMQRLSRGIRPNQERLYWDDLGSIRIPAPPRERQIVVAEEIDTVVGAFEDQRAPFLESIRSLEERKRALITAAVTGELDVTTAKPIGMGRWVPNVGASVEAPVAAQASSIGGIG